MPSLKGPFTGPGRVNTAPQKPSFIPCLFSFPRQAGGRLCRGSPPSVSQGSAPPLLPGGGRGGCPSSSSPPACSPQVGRPASCNSASPRASLGWGAAGGAGIDGTWGKGRVCSCSAAPQALSVLCRKCRDLGFPGRKSGFLNRPAGRHSPELTHPFTSFVCPASVKLTVTIKACDLRSRPAQKPQASSSSLTRPRISARPQVAVPAARWGEGDAVPCAIQWR